MFHSDGFLAFFSLPKPTRGRTYGATAAAVLTTSPTVNATPLTLERTSLKSPPLIVLTLTRLGLGAPAAVIPLATNVFFLLSAVCSQRRQLVFSFVISDASHLLLQLEHV